MLKGFKPSSAESSQKIMETKKQTHRSISVVEEKKSLLTCYICETKFESVTFNRECDLKRHLAVAHERKNPLQCLYCPANFSRKRYSSITDTIYHFEDINLEFRRSII